MASFISMDPPKHDVQRKVVQPVVAPANLAKLEPVIRERAAQSWMALPVGETFNWVDKVSIELTTQMLATLFDFPFEERRKLTYWSDVAGGTPELGGAMGFSSEERLGRPAGCLADFTGCGMSALACRRADDLISMLAHGEATRDMSTPDGVSRQSDAADRWRQ